MIIVICEEEKAQISLENLICKKGQQEDVNDIEAKGG